MGTIFVEGQSLGGAWKAICGGHTPVYVECQCRSHRTVFDGCGPDNVGPCTAMWRCTDCGRRWTIHAVAGGGRAYPGIPAGTPALMVTAPAPSRHEEGLMDWRTMDTAPLRRTVLLKCSDGVERIGKYHRGALWRLEDGGYVLDASRKAPNAVEAIEATHWK